MITRHMHANGTFHLHFRAVRRGGRVPLVLLHPSPRNSAMFEPLMRLLHDDLDLIAPDTPGYGASDPLPLTPQCMGDYLPSLHAFLQEVGGPRYMLYGSATGAQLAIAYANAYPEQVVHLFLDNAAHFEPERREQIVANYFPDLTPQKDGSHLLRAWQMAYQMTQFFPWFNADEGHRVSQRDPSGAELHTLAMEFLNAGPQYDAAYRAAFEHEHARNLQTLTVPTTVFRWLGSVLLPHIDDLLAQALPANIQVTITPRDMGLRYEVMRLAFLAAQPQIGLDCAASALLAAP